MMNMSALFMVFAVVIVSGVDATSWTNKQKQRNYEVQSLNKGFETEWTVTCTDELQGCSNIFKLCKINIVRQKCAGTCGVCRAAAPSDCKLTKYKCCWDNKTSAKGPNHEGCPACADKYAECKMFRSACDEPNVKTMCPVTCGVNCKQCADNKYQEKVCPMYKSYGFCKLSPDLMEKMCSKTCGFCPS